MSKDQTFSVSKLSEITKMDRRTIVKLLKAVPFEGGTSARPEWSLKCLETAGQSAVSANKGSSALKDQKLVEEIRKLRHLNDSNADMVVEKSAVCAAHTRCAHRLHEFRVELETKWPAKLAGLTDVSSARAECRRVADRIYEVFGAMAVEFGPLEIHPKDNQDAT